MAVKRKGMLLNSILLKRKLNIKKIENDFNHD
jgi:hypothetical protein